MATRKPFPPLHNWTRERFNRQLHDAGYYTPIWKCARHPRRSLWNEVLVGMGIFLIASVVTILALAYFGVLVK